VIRLI